MIRIFVTCLCLTAPASVCDAATIPNFVLFYVDDLGWADTSVRMMDDEPNIEKVDGGAMSEVYAAYFEWLDESLRKKEERFHRDLESLRRENPPDSDKLRAKLEADLQSAKHEYAAKTAICRDQTTNHSWRESTKQEVIKRLGVDKQGNATRTGQ